MSTTPSPGRPPVISRETVLRLRGWTAHQWTLVGVGFVLAFLIIGEVGQTLPPTDLGRVYPVEWWNWVTLLISAALIGLIVGTFAAPGGPRAIAGAGSGAGGVVAAMAMACPVCSPLALPLLGTGGLLAFLTPDRMWLALASVVLLVATLLLRLRAGAACELSPRPRPF